MIQRAKISEIPEILSMTNACRINMESKNIFQWTEEYPSKEEFLMDIKRKELYVLKREHTLIGSIVISTLMDDEYKNVAWLTSNAKNLYIHRLAIHPDYQGKGYAQQLMDFAENFAKQNDFISIRLDTFSQNSRNQRFYEARGYRKLEDIYFPNQSSYSFHCYELIV
ncbi:GNAT family N-acetyltransferase [Maribacter cobaltidurans]|uniref:GNAT family N-acetyltransferase n=1 Tax=Maribacter cobaltidurans TaxID=1178778 RepID=A0A223V5B2_9FLAO|nr:GNAT family N-acetyltransferase [Maribacter cobaltidurans]ASV30320.1 GNAT family N-acetyltransferase [Maribacter cobaltidurans]GGD77575.1 N-acetyltransferase [Maribacter cobaltidurans]